MEKIRNRKFEIHKTIDVYKFNYLTKWIFEFKENEWSLIIKFYLLDQEYTIYEIRNQKVKPKIEKDYLRFLITKKVGEVEYLLLNQ